MEETLGPEKATLPHVGLLLAPFADLLLDAAHGAVVAEAVLALHHHEPGVLLVAPDEGLGVAVLAVAGLRTVEGDTAEDEARQDFLGLTPTRGWE